MKWQRIRRKLLLPVLAGGLSLFVMLRWFEHHQVFQPDRFVFIPDGEQSRSFEDVFFQTADHLTLNGWFFPAATKSPNKDLAVLVCHGNAGNICHRLDLATALQATGVNVFLLDYRGYGRSQGSPSETGLCCDAVAGAEWLQRRGFAPSQIIAYGESLGGGVAADLASREDIGGLVLQSTFTSIPDLGAELFPWLPVHWIGHVRFNTLQRLPRLRIPVLVMHSRADELVRFRHAEKNFAAAITPKLFCEIQGNHNDALADRPAFITGIESFLKMVREHQRSQAASSR